jgi:type III pantothenate kinase
VIGAAALYPGKDTLVIDAGTAITFDFVDRDQNYYGGSISPGLAMRFRALHDYTGKLPHLQPDSVFTGQYGDDTRTAILSGVQQGIWHETSGHIAAFRARYPGLQVLLCGGDAAFFESRLKISIFAPIVKTEANLVLAGLNEVIFQYND